MTPPNQPPTSTPAQAAPAPVSKGVPEWAVKAAQEQAKVVVNLLTMHGIPVTKQEKMRTILVEEYTAIIARHAPPPAAPSAEGQDWKQWIRFCFTEQPGDVDDETLRKAVVAKWDELTIGLTAANERVAELEVQLAAYVKEAEANYTALSSERAALEAEVAQWKNNYSNQAGETSRFAREIDELNGKLTTAQSAAAAAEEENGRLKLTMERYDRIIKAGGVTATSWGTVRPHAVAQKADAGDDMTGTDSFREAVQEACDEATGALNNASPEDAPDILQSIAGKLTAALSSRNPPSESPSVAVEHGRLAEAVRVLQTAAQNEIDYQLRGDSLQKRLLDYIIDQNLRVEFEVWHSDRPTTGSLREALRLTEAALTSSATPPETPTEAGK